MALAGNDQHGGAGIALAMSSARPTGTVAFFSPWMIVARTAISFRGPDIDVEGGLRLAFVAPLPPSAIMSTIQAFTSSSAPAVNAAPTGSRRSPEGCAT
jgi:hypothetical protein